MTTVVLLKVLNAINYPIAGCVVWIISLTLVMLRELAILRSGIKIENQTSATICFHHKKVFLDRFESQHTTCFDPLQRHKKLLSQPYEH